MRDYLSFPNLRKAALLGAGMTVMSTPRIILAGLPVSYIAAAYAGLILFGGMATAWSHYAGMKGLVASRRETLTGLAVAAGLLLLLVPVQAKCLNPVFKEKLVSIGNTDALDLLFPKTLKAGIALMLWAMSFEPLFFQAAVMSFFAKLTKQIRVTILLAVMVRLLVAMLKLGEIGIASGDLFILLCVGIVALISCVLFALYGLPAVMLLAGGMVFSRWTFLWD